MSTAETHIYDQMTMANKRESIHDDAEAAHWMGHIDEDITKDHIELNFNKDGDKAIEDNKLRRRSVLVSNPSSHHVFESTRPDEEEQKSRILSQKSEDTTTHDEEEQKSRILSQKSEDTTTHTFEPSDLTSRESNSTHTFEPSDLTSPESNSSWSGSATISHFQDYQIETSTNTVDNLQHISKETNSQANSGGLLCCGGRDEDKEGSCIIS